MARQKVFRRPPHSQPKRPKLQKLFRYEIPDLQKFVGRSVVIDGKTVVIDTICGNKGMMMRAPEEQTPHYCEINNKYRISFIRFFAQMEGATDITEEQFLAFESTQFHIEKATTRNDEKRLERVVDKMLHQEKMKNEAHGSSQNSSQDS